MRTFDFRSTPENTSRYPRERMARVKIGSKDCETLQVNEPFTLVTDHGNQSGEASDVIVVDIETGEARVEKHDDLNKTVREATPRA